MLVTILQVIACFQVFGLIDVMTKGGPGGATRSLVYYIFERAFGHGQLGYASAIAFCLFAIVFVLSITQLRIFRRSRGRGVRRGRAGRVSRSARRRATADGPAAGDLAQHRAVRRSSAR